MLSSRAAAANSERPPGATVLIVSPVLPWPALAGKHIDIAGHVTSLQDGGARVVVVVLRELSDEFVKRVHAGTFPAETRLVPRTGRYGPPAPDCVEGLQRVIDDVRPDIVWCEHADTVPLVSEVQLRGAELWWRPQNFELGQHFEKARPGFRWTAESRIGALWTWLPSRTGRRIHAAEQAMFRTADRIFFISNRDRQTMSALYGNREGMFWLPPRLPSVAVPVKPAKVRLDVVYVANNYSSPTQLDGAERLLDEIIPRIEAAAPGKFRFHLVGRGSERLDARFPASLVVTHGFVDDLSALLRDMDVSCIPVSIGWGLKIKMAEALSAGLPVLASPVAFQSLPPAPGAFSACEDAEAYVRALLALRDPDERRQMADAGTQAWARWCREGESRLFEELARVCREGGRLDRTG